METMLCGLQGKDCKNAKETSRLCHHAEVTLRAWFGRAAELALQQRQLQARVEQLEGYNAHLIRQLSATLRTLRSERANTHAEITRMHQKVAFNLTFRAFCYFGRLLGLCSILHGNRCSAS